MKSSYFPRRGSRGLCGEDIMKASLYQRRGSRGVCGEDIGMAPETAQKQRLDEMKKDQIAREKEWSQDMIVQERAGLHGEDLNKIPKLDATNNCSYKYLRDHGNNYEYDPFEMDLKWKNRLYRRFDTLDKNNDNVLLLADVLSWPDIMQFLCQANTEEIEKVRGSIKLFFEARGVTDAGLHRENWIEANRVFVETEKQRKANDIPPLTTSLLMSYFDAIEEDNENMITIEELNRMMNVFRIPEECSFTFFYHVDNSKKGEVEREEIIQLFTDFWFGDYDSKLDGVFAYKY